MLQIATGKFFAHDIERKNLMRGVLFTNLRASFEATAIETIAGTLKPSTSFHGLRSFTYEMIERMEGGPHSGALVSVGADAYLRDMATVTSFALNVTCTPDHDLARRLIGDPTLGPNTSTAPRKYIARVFDAEVWMQDHEAEEFCAFVAELIGLDRKHYLGAIRSIRTYVTGLQRIGDDIDLAYTLLVASIESLAQGFDGHEAVWSDYDQQKRAKIDAALDGADREVAERVRAALLEVEHVALTRRFRAFALENLKPSFFREEAKGQIRPVGRTELIEAISHAYTIRSKYMHTLAEVPKLISHVWDHSDTVRIERKPYLTIHGLARLARHLIFEFVRKAPKIEKETYQYRLDFPGVVQMEMAAQYWVWQHEQFEVGQSLRKFEGFLQLVAGVQTKQKDAPFVDLRDLLRRYEELIPQAKPNYRLPMVATYYLFNALVGPDNRVENAGSFEKPYMGLLDPPSLEGLGLRFALGQEIEWSASELADLGKTYYQRKYRANGFTLPQIYEVALCLSITEAYRREGNLADATASIEAARDNLPSVSVLVDAAAQLAEKPDEPIIWMTLLLPNEPEVAPEGDALDSQSGTVP